MKKLLLLLAVFAAAPACAAAQRSPGENTACAIANAASPLLNSIVDEFIAIVTGGGSISDQSEAYVSGLEQAYRLGDAVLCPSATSGAMMAPVLPSARLHAFMLAHPGHTFPITRVTP